MPEKLSTLDFQRKIAAALEKISYDLYSLREELVELTHSTWEPPLQKPERKIIERFVLSCALYQPNSAVRRESWGTRGPSEFLAAIEWVVQKLEQGK